MVMEYNGILVGLILIILGGLQAWYISNLLIPCVEKTGGTWYEEFARHAYGVWMEKFTGLVICFCCLGFVISYSIFL